MAVDNSVGTGLGGRVIGNSGIGRGGLWRSRHRILERVQTDLAFDRGFDIDAATIGDLQQIDKNIGDLLADMLASGRPAYSSDV